MTLLKNIFNFYIFGNIHVALATFCLTKITLLAYAISSDLLSWFVFFATFLSYNLIRIYQLNDLQDWFYNFIRSNKQIILILSVLSFMFLVFLTFKLELKTLFTLIPFGLFTFFYVIPFNFKLKGAVSLRSITLVKLFLIAVSWAGVTVIVPLVEYNLGFSKNNIFMFIQRFFFIIAITIPFDIRDINFDNEKIRTLPQVFGIKKSKPIGMFSLMVFLGLELFKEPVEAEALRIKFIVALISLFLLMKSTAHQDKYYSAFLVESIPIVWFILYLLFN